MLLPIYKEDNSDNLEEDPREELINLLSEYQKYQETGKKLGELPILGRDTFKKVNEKAPKQDRPLHSTELFQLINSYQNVINKYKDQFSTYDLSTPSKSLQEKLIEIITKYPEGFSSQALENLLTPPITKNEIVVSFLAILELTKRGFLKIMQPIESGDILISTIKPLNDLDMNLIQNELFTEELYGKR
jgi:segregation and condensation protein A